MRTVTDFVVGGSDVTASKPFLYLDEQPEGAQLAQQIAALLMTELQTWTLWQHLHVVIHIRH